MAQQIRSPYAPAVRIERRGRDGHLSDRSGHIEVDDPAWRPAVMAAANLLELLAQAPDRICRCQNPGCVLWFFDTTRNGTRRWCSMEVCGNRAKARRHYNRVRKPAAR